MTTTTTASGTLRAAIYVRVSTLPQEEHGYGLEAQLKDCRKLAADTPATIVAEYQDVDSGASWTLPGLNGLLDAATRHEFDIVICYDPDRLSRRMAKYVILDQELKKASVSLRFVTIRTGDTPEDRAMQQMKAVFAELDYERIIFRMMRGKRVKAEKGLIVGTGVPPYGYRAIRNEKGRTVGLAEDLDTAPTVRRIFRDVQAMSLRHVCDALDADGIPTYFRDRGARGWNPGTVKSILTNPVYLGTAPYGRRNGAKHWQNADTWIYSPAPVLIDRREWDAAHEALERRNALQQRTARSPETDAAYPLRGLLRCAHCGRPLHTAINGVANGMYRYYQCRRGEPAYARRNGIPVCPLPSVPAGPLEALAWDEVVATLLDPERMREGMAAARAEYAAAASRQRARLGTLDGEASRLRDRLGRIIEEQLSAPAGSETVRLLREKAQQIEAALGRLAAERGGLAAESAAGLSDGEAEDLASFAAEVRAGADHATTIDRRRVFQLLKLTGTVRRDAEHGIRFAKKNRFSVDWTAILQLRDNGRNFVNIKTVWIGPADARQ